MLTLRRAAVAAAMLSGLLAMGADPPLPVKPLSRSERAAKLLPTPRLFEITTVVDGKPRGPAQFCLSAETMLRQMGAGRAGAPEPAPASTASPSPATAERRLSPSGCKTSFERRADGATHMNMTCDKAAGARFTSHMIADMAGDMQDMRVRSELTLDVPQPHTTIIESHTVIKGDCPADLKPGEMRLPDGRTVDATHRLTSAPNAAPEADPKH